MIEVKQIKESTCEGGHEVDIMLNLLLENLTWKMLREVNYTLVSVKIALSYVGKMFKRRILPHMFDPS